MSMKLCSAIMLSALTAVALAGCADNEGSGPTSTDLKFASPVAPGSSSFADGDEWVLEEISSRTDGSVDTEPFWSGELVSPLEGLAAVQDGRADGAYITPIFFPGTFPLWELAGVPLLSEDPVAQMLAFADLYENNEALQAEIDAQDIHILYFYPVSPSTAFLTEPVSSPADFKGLSLRANGQVAQLFESLGATPVALDPTEMYDAMERGVIQGVGAQTFEAAPGFSLDEITTTVVNPQFGTYASAGAAVSKSLWDGLSEDEKSIIDEVVAEYYDEQAQRFLDEQNDRACEAFTAGGADFEVFDPDEVRTNLGSTPDDLLAAWKDVVSEKSGDAALADEFLAAYEASYDNFSDTGFVEGVTKCAEAQ